jgi:hypothetical protein
MLILDVSKYVPVRERNMATTRESRVDVVEWQGQCARSFNGNVAALSSARSFLGALSSGVFPLTRACIVSHTGAASELQPHASAQAHPCERGPRQRPHSMYQ